MIGREIRVNIEMDKEELIKILKKNLTAHDKAHKKAMIGWNKKITKLSLKVAGKAKNNKITEKPADLAAMIHDMPDDYSETYVAAIEMFGHHEEGNVVLSSDNYDKLVRNNWEWSKDWSFKNSRY